MVTVGGLGIVEADQRGLIHDRLPLGEVVSGLLGYPLLSASAASSSSTTAGLVGPRLDPRLIGDRQTSASTK
ncbi:hypothetical protein OHB00_00715 [Streptomyces sp. NBC_00631]|uniref:hypothetical protein n=1 Tax=Streptomyces sp. NBC_00631 TaxID=2975793 RepID=UPI0030E38A0F